ncbi:MAG: hypothetical protein LBG89_01205 [Rickettsiales bacterium]|jgi:hypothetical protein|nr:hypothetical protein [Rickettsiales bacterium]
MDTNSKMSVDEIRESLGFFRLVMDKKMAVAERLRYVAELFAELDRFVAASGEYGLDFKNKFMPEAYEEFFKGKIAAVDIPENLLGDSNKWPWPFESKKGAAAKDFYERASARFGMIKAADAAKPEYDIVMPKLTPREYDNIWSYISEYRKIMDTELNYANSAVIARDLALAADGLDAKMAALGKDSSSYKNPAARMGFMVAAKDDSSKLPVPVQFRVPAKMQG